MNSVINIKTEKNIKEEAQKIASAMGLSLSSVINVYLRSFIRTKKIVIDLSDIPLEIESRWKNERKQAKKNFTDAKTLIKESLM